MKASKRVLTVPCGKMHVFPLAIFRAFTVAVSCALRFDQAHISASAHNLVIAQDENFNGVSRNVKELFVVERT